MSEQATAETSLPEGLEWHPDAVRPPFRWSMELPSDWAVIDTRPARWKRCVERVTDDSFAGRRLPASVRRDVEKHLADVVAAAQRARMMLVLMKVGLSEDGTVPESVGMTLRWTSSAPMLASMATVRRAIGSGLTEFATRSGYLAAYRVDHREQAVGSSSRTVSSVQAFLPVPGTSWTLVCTVSAPRTDLDETLQAVVVRCVGSVRKVGEASISDNGAPGADEGADDSGDAALEIDEAEIKLAEAEFSEGPGTSR